MNPDLRETRSRSRKPLEAFFVPQSVAVVGATDREGSVGRTVLLNLTLRFPGILYPINPKRSELRFRATTLAPCPSPSVAVAGDQLRLSCYPSLTALPKAADFAVVVTPAATVPTVVGQCVSAGVRAIVVISAGFKEKGAEGVALEKQIQRELQGTGVRLIGPNCLGVMNPWSGLNATFAHEMVQPGSVAFLSQSGALLTAILDWSLTEQVGFSAIVSTGSMLDVGWGDLISYFGDDAKTQSILLYMESIGDARAFLSAAREVALDKPIIVIKAGRSEAASKAAASHTGAMTGRDEVFDAACRRCGVLRVQSISDVFHMAEALSKQPRPRGPRLLIVTNAGGPGVLATDALIASGGELAPLPSSARVQLDEFLPPHWSHGNPIDILGDADPERYARALEVAIADPDSDGSLVVLAPQGMTNPAEVAERLAPHAKKHGKPLLASWMGGKLVAEGVAKLNSAGIPTFSYPDTAARAFQLMWTYTYNLRGVYETPAVVDDPAKVGAERREKARGLVERVLRSRRTLLTEVESKELLHIYGIPTVATRLAASADQATELAVEMGFPVALKVHSEVITHKSDVGGVRLNLQDCSEVCHAFEGIRSAVAAKAGQGAFLGVTVQPMVRLDGYELIVGSSADPQFGPVLLFGSGGQLVEVYHDRALGLPPLNTTLAQRLMEQTRIYTALKGVRGRKGLDLIALERLLVRFSQLVVEQPRIKEIDINPLLAAPEQLLALDARVVLYGPDVGEGELPRPAIRPYPAEYVSHWTTQNGGEVTIRPIRPEDEPRLVEFHQGLSNSSVYLRFFHLEKLDSRVTHERLIRRCFIDYDREIALIAEKNGADEQRQILAVARLAREARPEEAELGILVSDHSQRMGLGRELCRNLLAIAKSEGIRRIVARILPENAAMLALARSFGFRITRDEDPLSYFAILEVTG